MNFIVFESVGDWIIVEMYQFFCALTYIIRQYYDRWELYLDSYLLYLLIFRSTAIWTDI